jgi:hypothetical protein
VVILQDSGNDSDVTYGVTSRVGVTPVSWSEFVRRFKADAAMRGESTGYVLSHDGRGVSSIAQVYFP